MHNGSIRQVTVSAPATCSNLAVGFDCLGFALSEPADEVCLERRDTPGLLIRHIDAPFTLPDDISQNTASIALSAFWKDHGDPAVGFDMDIKKGIPLASGLGGSAASAVAALVAGNAFLETPLDRSELLPYAITAEASSSGCGHADNAAPCLFGGMVLCVPDQPVITLPDLPLSAVVYHPDLLVPTREARACLPKSVTLSQSIQSAGCLAHFIHACYDFNADHWPLFSTDHVIEPARSHLWPHYSSMKQAALSAGAISVCVSGSGPTLLAWVLSDGPVAAVRQAFEESAVTGGYTGQSWISDQSGAKATIKEINGCAIAQH